MTGEAPSIRPESQEKNGAVRGAAMQQQPTLNKESSQAPKAIPAGPPQGKNAPQNQLAKRPQTSWSISPEGKLIHEGENGIPETVAFPGNVDFFALAAVGEAVWVGGAKGVLYRSVDDGVSWRRLPSPSQQDLLDIEFSNRQDGLLTDADGKNYVTHDGGQNWQVADSK